MKNLKNINEWNPAEDGSRAARAGMVDVLSIESFEGPNTVTVKYHTQDKTYHLNVIGGDSEEFETFEAVFHYIVRNVDTLDKSLEEALDYNEQFFKRFD